MRPGLIFSSVLILATKVSADVFQDHGKDFAEALEIVVAGLNQKTQSGDAASITATDGNW